MSKCQCAKKIINELLGDGKVHTIDEMVSLALERHVIENKKDSAVKNALFQMKKQNTSIINVDKGKYKMLIANDRNVKEKEVFEESISYVFLEIRKLKEFDWMNCTNEELAEARKKVMKLKEVYEEINCLIKYRTMN